MLVNSGFLADARIEKEARSLLNGGHQVSVIAVQDRNLPSVEMRDGIKTYRIRMGLHIAQGFVKASLQIKNLFSRKKKSIRVPPSEDLSARKPEIISVSPLRAAFRRYYFFINYVESVIGFGFNSYNKLLLLKPDVVHVHDLNACVGALAYCKKVRIPLVYDSHELWQHRNLGTFDPPPFWIRRFDSKIEQALIEYARDVITVSPSIINHLTEKFKLKPITLLRNVPEVNQNLNLATDIKEELGLDPGTFLMSYTGRITFHRGLEDIVKSLKQLPEEFHLLILGNFDPRFEVIFSQLVGSLGIQKRIHHVQAVHHSMVTKKLAGVDLALVAVVGQNLSYQFSLPNKIFEAIGAGLPVLCSDLPDMKALVQQYECGTVIKDMSAEALATQLLSLRQDRPQLQKWADHSKEAAKILNWKEEEKKLLAIYDRISEAIDKS